MASPIYTSRGEAHGLINVLPNSVKDDDFKHMKPEIKAKCEKQKKEDNRMVKARYINHRGSHERLTKPYMRWAGDPIKIYHLIPDHVYELPLGFVNEINASGLAQRSKEDNDRTPVDKKTGVERLHELVPVSF